MMHNLFERRFGDVSAASEMRVATSWVMPEFPTETNVPELKGLAVLRWRIEHDVRVVIHLPMPFEMHRLLTHIEAVLGVDVHVHTTEFCRIGSIQAPETAQIVVLLLRLA